MEEFLAIYSSLCSSESLELGIKGFSRSIRCPVVEVENVIVVLIERSSNDIEGMEASLFDFVVPSGQGKSCCILDGVLCKNHPQGV